MTCGVLGFSTQAFYKWRSRAVSATATSTTPTSPTRWSTPTATTRSSVTGSSPTSSSAPATTVGRAAGVAAVLADQRLWSTTTRKGRRGIGQAPGPAVHDDLVQRDFTRAAPERMWLTDITEHPTAEGKLYCCAIKDVFSNRIVGYSIDERMTAQLAVAALRAAIARRQPDGTVVVHSDRGQQFRSRAFRAVLERRRAHRVDGPGRLRRRQRSDGIVLLAAAEERPGPPALAHPRRAALRDRATGSSTPTTAAAANARLGKLTPVEFELAFTSARRSSSRA